MKLIFVHCLDALQSSKNYKWITIREAATRNTTRKQISWALNNMYTKEAD
jgi:hypothetical protein